MSECESSQGSVRSFECRKFSSMTKTENPITPRIFFTWLASPSPRSPSFQSVSLLSMGIDYISFIGYGIPVTDMPCFEYLFENADDFENKRSSFGRKNKILEWKFYDLVDFLMYSIKSSSKVDDRREATFKSSEECPETTAFYHSLVEKKKEAFTTVNISLVFEEVPGEDGNAAEIYILSEYTYLSLNLREEGEISPVNNIRKSDRNAFKTLTLGEEKAQRWFGGYSC